MTLIGPTTGEISNKPQSNLNNFSNRITTKGRPKKRSHKSNTDYSYKKESIKYNLPITSKISNRRSKKESKLSRSSVSSGVNSKVTIESNAVKELENYFNKRNNVIKRNSSHQTCERCMKMLHHGLSSVQCPIHRKC